MPVSETVRVSLSLVDRGSERVEVGVGVSDRLSEAAIVGDGLSFTELVGDSV